MQTGPEIQTIISVNFMIPQAAQALSMNHRNIIIRVCMGFSTKHPWKQLKITNFNKNGLPYAISVLFASGAVIISI